jgi:hypothetical protein
MSPEVNGIIFKHVQFELKRPSAFYFMSEKQSVLFQTKYFSNFVMEKYIVSLLISLLQNSDRELFIKPQQC